jgi:hypothetical protein
MVASTSPRRSMSCSADSIRASMSATVAWYSDACSGVRLHHTFISILSGRSEMIDRSVFTRRRMNGPVSRFSRSAASSSPCRSTGTAKLVRNFSAGPSSPGLVNSMIDHSSPSRFSTGVPVSAIREAAGRLRTARACRVPAFLMFCASSQTTRCQPTAASSSRSRAAIAYVVMTRSAALSASRNSAPDSRSDPWCTCTTSSGVNRSASFCQLPTTDIGQTSSVGPGRC